MQGTAHYSQHGVRALCLQATFLVKLQDNIIVSRISVKVVLL